MIMYLFDNQVWCFPKCFVVPENDFVHWIFVCMFAGCLSSQHPRKIKRPVKYTVIIGYV